MSQQRFKCECSNVHFSSIQKLQICSPRRALFTSVISFALCRFRASCNVRVPRKIWEIENFDFLPKAPQN
jgi:hypothetical protein